MHAPKDHWRLFGEQALAQLIMLKVMASAAVPEHADTTACQHGDQLSSRPLSMQRLTLPHGATPLNAGSANKVPIAS